MSGEMSGDIIWAINKINAAHAAMDLSKTTADALAQVMATLSAHHGTWDDFSPQIRMWRVLADAAQNRVLHALARCLFYFQIQSGVGLTGDQGSMQSETVLALTRRICTAVSNGHALAALDAVTRLEKVSRA
jgi:DNA-binding FadR family transcriptional regulator